MPVLKHAKKKLRQDKMRTIKNKKQKTLYRDLVKDARENPTKESVSKAFQAVDKAAKKNLIHDNKAGRLKSALSKVLDGGKSEKKTAPAKPVKKASKPAKAKTASKKSPAKKK